MDPTHPASYAIAQVIQLAVAPVFLLTGVGFFLTVLTNRLARVVDRARQTESEAKATGSTVLPRHKDNLRVLARRARIIYRAITLSTVCALLVALVVVTLFSSALLGVNLSAIIATMFIMAMLCLIAGLLLFLREVFMAITSLKIGVTHN